MPEAPAATKVTAAEVSMTATEMTATSEMAATSEVSTATAMESEGGGRKSKTSGGCRDERKLVQHCKFLPAYSETVSSWPMNPR